MPVETRLAAPSLQVRKRSGKIVDYSKQKIAQAVRLCLINGCRRADTAETTALGARVAERVEKILRQSTGTINVEMIQDVVEQALMALGEHEAARQYIIYREEHRKLREAAVTANVSEAETQAIREDGKYFQNDLQRFQHYDKYARFNDNHKRRETFLESATRMVDFLQWHLVNHGRPALTEGEMGMLKRAILNEKATPSMRLMQMAGPAAKRCNVGVYNCAFLAITDLDCFAEALYVSMQGTGIGFSCESEFIEQLPMIGRRNPNIKSEIFVVPDTTEGWCDSVKMLARALYAGLDLDIQYHVIRPEGAKLVTKGGTASGARPLQDLHAAMRRIFRAREGRRLRDIDVHDVMCYIGQVGQMGGVRRAALISLSDLGSAVMREAKTGAFWGDPLRVQRTMSNNSAVYHEKPTMEVFMDEWLSLVKSKSGERGIFNRGGIIKQMPQRRRDVIGSSIEHIGTNPCGEIALQSFQFCNLSIAICREDDTEETLMNKIEIAAIFGTLQASMTDFSYIRPRWAENCERERLLGVDLLGALDCPLLRAANPDRDALLGRLAAHAVAVNVRWSLRIGINPSTAVTCIKPGGNSGARWRTGQSMSGWLSEHMIRNVEVSNVNPMCRFLKDAGVPSELSYRDPGTTVFSFPLKAPPQAMIVSDPVIDAGGKIIETKPRRSAVEQLEDWKSFKVNYTEHNPSVTVYVADHEWLAVGDWVFKNWDIVGGLAFLPLDGGIYPQAPFTPVTQENFEKFMAAWPAIPWEKFPRYEGGLDHTNMRRELACTGEKCSV